MRQRRPRITNRIAVSLTETLDSQLSLISDLRYLRENIRLSRLRAFNKFTAAVEAIQVSDCGDVLKEYVTIRT